jgi:urease accessory protein
MPFMLMTAPTLLDQPRAKGAAMVSIKSAGGVSRLDGLRQSGALKLLFPRRDHDIHAIAINTAGGITGGDRFDLTARAGSNTQLTVSTQAAERIYRAHPGQTGRVRTGLVAEEGASLTWAPQETIVFDHAALHRQLDVDLAETARFVMVEPMLFGRTAMGETICHARIDDRIVIRRAGRTIYRDGLHLWGDLAAQLDRPAIGDGARAMASLVLAGADASGHLGPVRNLIRGQGGASLKADDLLVVRLLAKDGFDLRQTLVPILDLLTKHTLPQSWRL